MFRIVCEQCQKPLSLDEAKLPFREVSFPCPVCKAKVSVDRRNLSQEQVLVTAPPEPPPLWVAPSPESMRSRSTIFAALKAVEGREDYEQMKTFFILETLLDLRDQNAMLLELRHIRG